MDQLDDITAKESILEESIMAPQDYDDVLVRSEDDKVHVHVKVDELSDDEVIHIMQMIRDEFGDVKLMLNNHLRQIKIFSLKICNFLVLNMVSYLIKYVFG